MRHRAGGTRTIRFVERPAALAVTTYWRSLPEQGSVYSKRPSTPAAPSASVKLSSSRRI
jgi:hypothetical protein